MQFDVKVSNAELTKVINQINAYDGKTRLGVEKAMRTGTRRIQRDAAARIHNRTGRLKQSLKASFSTTKLEGSVYAKAKYAHLVEFGAKAIMIKVKRSKDMKFTTHKGTVYAEEVHIPKRSPKPFLKPAYDKNASSIVSDVKKAVRK